MTNTNRIHVTYGEQQPATHLEGDSTKKTYHYTHREAVTETQIERERYFLTTEEQGRRAWSALHSYEGCDQNWYLIWRNMIPTGCSCQSSAHAMLAQYPPDCSSPETFFDWGVFIHNMINEKLGKPIMSHEEARKLWRGDKPDGTTQDSGEASS
jgi:hypothetical protein